MARGGEDRGGDKGGTVMAKGGDRENPITALRASPLDYGVAPS